jgi:hypothetical protein
MDARYVAQWRHFFSLFRLFSFFVAQTFEGREDEIGFYPNVIQTRHLRPPRIGWMAEPVSSIQSDCTSTTSFSAVMRSGHLPRNAMTHVHYPDDTYTINNFNTSTIVPLHTQCVTTS